MGKRVDFSARTVVTADPNLSIAEVGGSGAQVLPMAIGFLIGPPSRVLLAAQLHLHFLQVSCYQCTVTHTGPGFVLGFVGPSLLSLPCGQHARVACLMLNCRQSTVREQSGLGFSSMFWLP